MQRSTKKLLHNKETDSLLDLCPISKVESKQNHRTALKENEENPFLEGQDGDDEEYARMKLERMRKKKLAKLAKK
jgi:hypothetical protein